jgi:CubicO group peptidase (beta-lactamase class C family)
MPDNAIYGGNIWGYVCASVFAAPALSQSAAPAAPPAVAATTPPLSAAQIAELDAYIERARIAWRVPGLSVAIVQNDQIVYLKGFGQRDIAGNLPVTPDTMFAGASTSKAFTSAGIGILVDEGRLNWDEPVQTYLPTFSIADRATGAQITLRDMLSHRTGMPRHDAVWYNNTQLSRADLIGRLRFLPSSAPLRSRWQYNNMMYITAGFIAGQTAGTTWEDFTRQRLFQPLGMTRTNFSVSDMAADPDHATAYKLNDSREITAIPLRNVDFIGPAGSINSTARDYANWVRLHLNNGMFEGRRIVSEQSMQAMHAPVMPLGSAPDPEFPQFSPQLYGMGWFVDSYRGEQRVQHGGNLDGFTARVTVFPGRNLGIVTFVNLEVSPLPGYLSVDILDRVAGNIPVNFAETTLARRDIAERTGDEAERRLSETQVRGTRPAHPIADYAGTYTDPGYGSWTFAVAANGRMTGTYNGMAVRFEHWHYEQFRGNPVRTEDDGMENTRANFVTDLRGRIGAVQIEMDPLVPAVVFTRQPDASMADPARLATFAGSYRLRDQTLTVELNGSTLVLTVPGQSPFRLVPESDGNFVLETQRSITARFVSERGRVVRLQLLQPNGVFDAERVVVQE